MGLCHPPLANGITMAMFLDEVTDLQNLYLNTTNITLLGDFNMHTEDTSDPYSIIFNNTMEALGLTQHVKSPTHKQGDILDLMFSEANGQLSMSNCQVGNYISAIITIDTNITKRKPPLMTKLIRDSSQLTKENMQSNFKEPMIEVCLGLSHIYDQFTTALQNMVDNTAPLKEIKSIDKQHKPYYNKYIRNQQKIVKSRERI